MVEKDSGRSRGFGFVSYDSPDAAALAIKELNGYAVRMNIVLLWLLYVCFSHFSHLVSVVRLAICFSAVSSDWK